MPGSEIPDYYEFMEISPQATQETIHRVYRFLAVRYHPDHPATGDLEKFAQLTSAYKVLSDTAARSEYNLQRATRDPAIRNPLSDTVDFMDQAAGDLNRRLAVLAILYYRRRLFPHNPEVTLAEIEQRMGFPRDYLDFTIWYLIKKRYITRSDNGELTLTVEGVDFVESQRTSIPLLNNLLTTGTATDGHEIPERVPASGPATSDGSDDLEHTVDFSAEDTATAFVDQRSGRPASRSIEKSPPAPTSRPSRPGPPTSDTAPPEPTNPTSSTPSTAAA